jgi:hypothetical protein
MTSEQKRDHIAALLREREGYVRYGRDEKVQEVDAQLAKFGHGAKPPAKRATRMMSPPASTEL